MNPEDWYFVIDENLEPRVVELLEAEGFRADRVSSDILFRGAEDVDDVIEHAVEQDAIIVTNNWRDFKRFDTSIHNGVLIVFDNKESAWNIAKWTMSAAEAFQEPFNCTEWYALSRFD
jgi:predicted nuclease of predicted toxin-antitoxin system